MPTIPEDLEIAVQHHQEGRLQAAEQMYRRILQADPNQVDALHLLGVIAHQVGNHAVAVEFINRSIQLKGDEAHIHNNLGGAYRALRKFPDAVACFRRAISLQSDFMSAHVNLANAFNDQGQLEEVIACYRNILELKPDYGEVRVDLGNALKSQGKLDDAIACYRQALSFQPDFAAAHINLGVGLNEQGRVDEAIACYQRALELQPDFAEAHNNLGIALKDLGKLEEAVACSRRALDLKPDYADAHNNLGNALSDQGKMDEAVACFHRAVTLQPTSVKAHSNLGVALKAQGKLDQAVASFRRALQLNPHDAEINNNLGVTLKSQGQLDEAVAYCRLALQLKPDYADAHNNLGNALKDQGKLDEAISAYRRAVELQPDFVVAHSNLVYTQVFSADYDRQALCEEHCRWNRSHAAHLANFIQPCLNERSLDRRLRVGYVSPDFRNHVVGRNLLPLFQEHDHQRFEIFCYADVPSPDDLTSHFRGYADTWRETAGQTDEQLTQCIREDRIDILVDLTLHMARNRLLVFARKPAPIQVTFAGYPGTTGLTTIDYRLTDCYLDPPGENDHCYSERSFRLPDSFWCYDPLESHQAVNTLPAFEKGYVTFGCLNNFCKVNNSVLKIWAQVLNAVDGSRLVLLAGEGSHRQQTLDVLSREGITNDRVTFVANQTRQQYLNYYHEIDVGLDTVPYNGHSTSLDSFWMGVPVVTLVGSTVPGRAGLCQLMNLGLPELIADSPEQYVRIAADLARDLPRLSELRLGLRERMEASPLMDSPRFARSIEAAYTEMWRRWCGS